MHQNFYTKSYIKTFTFSRKSSFVI